MEDHSIIGALRLGERPTLMTHRDAFGRTFFCFVRRRLLPWLKPNDVVVSDNLKIHKMLTVRTAIASVGTTAVYLPTHSPEFNPIERLWADMKRELRRLALHLAQELQLAVRSSRAAFPMEKLADWFLSSLGLVHHHLNRSPC